MSREINLLMLKMEQLRTDLEGSWEKTGEALSLAVELGGEFEQEISTDLGGIQVRLRKLTDDLDTVIGETKTLIEDFDLMEKSLRGKLDDEENYKLNAEHIQEEMREDEEF